MVTDLKGTILIGISKGAYELGFNSHAIRVTRKDFYVSVH